MEKVKKAVIGKDDCVEKILMAILGGGHVLMDDIPGVGKTTMALAFSRSCSLEENRMQFTPDVMPSDITGFSIYRKDTSEFVYQPGPIMCNLFLADEINRTSPKTQSALLEVMEEGKGDGGSCDQRTSPALCGDRYPEPGGFFGNPDASGFPAGSFYDLYLHGISRCGA